MSTIADLGNNVGLIYSTDLAGNFINTGASNTPGNADAFKRHALNRAPNGAQMAAYGSIELVAIGANDNITALTIDGVDQFDTSSPVAVTIGAVSDAVVALTQAVNNYIPSSGVNYRAFASGNFVILQAPASAEGTVNGDVVNLTFGIPLSQTWNENDVDFGQQGNENLSEINGVRYYINANSSAVVGNLTGATEITNWIVMRGNNTPPYEYEQTIADSSITSLIRYDRVTKLDLGASGATDLNSINGEFAKGDIMILVNDSAFTITVNDISIGSGNLMLNPTSFAMLNDDYILTLMYLEDATNGVVWKELWRTPQTVAALSITNSEIADLAVSTAKIKDTSVTNVKMATDSVDTVNILNDAVTTAKILDSNITTAKILDLNVTRAKLALLAVDSTILDTAAVTTDKIAAGAVTLAKLDTGLNKGFFTFSVSWDSVTELGQVKAAIPFDMTVTKIVVSVADTVEATDDATVIFKDQSLASMGQVDISGGVVIGNDFTLNPTVSNTFVAGESMTFETLKTTPGGRAEVTVIYDRT